MPPSMDEVLKTLVALGHARQAEAYAARVGGVAIQILFIEKLAVNRTATSKVTSTYETHYFVPDNSINIDPSIPKLILGTFLNFMRFSMHAAVPFTNLALYKPRFVYRSMINTV
jgi:hypothetical protein